MKKLLNFLLVRFDPVWTRLKGYWFDPDPASAWLFRSYVVLLPATLPLVFLGRWLFSLEPLLLPADLGEISPTTQLAVLRVLILVVLGLTWGFVRLRSAVRAEWAARSDHFLVFYLYRSLARGGPSGLLLLSMLLILVGPLGACVANGDFYRLIGVWGLGLELVVVFLGWGVMLLHLDPAACPKDGASMVGQAASKLLSRPTVLAAALAAVGLTVSTGVDRVGEHFTRTRVAQINQDTQVKVAQINRETAQINQDTQVKVAQIDQDTQVKLAQINRETPPSKGWWRLFVRYQ